ncbi:MAG: FAD-dependent oxidoreductase [Candidatus Levyibacteriota bacterium]
MKIAVIGAGFTGLSIAYQLSKKGHEIYLFEKDKNPGGLAIGFRKKEWKWSLEQHYHHWFTNDKNVLNLAKELEYKVVIKRPKTSIYIKGSMTQLDSPGDVLTFPLLSPFERLRMGIILALFKYNPVWRPLEKFNAAATLPKLMGKKPYVLIWEPLFINKFGKYKDDISLAWFWARITKRTPSLAYPQGGYLEFAQIFSKKIEDLGTKVFYGTSVDKIEQEGNKVRIHFNGKSEIFDKAIVTLPSFFFARITKGLPEKYKKSLLKLKGLGAINLVLRLREPFLKDGTYWLSICEKNALLMSIVEHTNFMDKKFYNNEHLVYLGNYLPANHRYMKMEAEELLREYDPLLKKISPEYKKNIKGFEIFKTPFAQPIIPVNYSRMIPPFKTPIKNLYLANIQQVYPWDRGTNYAIELGEKVCREMKS